MECPICGYQAEIDEAVSRPGYEPMSCAECGWHSYMDEAERARCAVEYEKAMEAYG